MADLRIALAQIDTCVGDLEGNAESVLAWSRRAADAGAHLVAFPEMTLTGYPIEDLALRGSFRRAAWDAAVEVATRLDAEGLGALTVVLGTVGSSGEGRARVGQDHGLPTNRAVVIRDGAVVTSYDKRHLPNYGVFDEFRIFTPGSRPATLEVRGRRVGLLICEDIWQDGPTADVARLGCDLLLVVNGSPYEEGKEGARTDLVARRAAQVGAPVAYVNMVGGQDDLVFDGGSIVTAADGTVLAQAPRFDEHLLLWDLPDDGVARPGEIAAPTDPDETVYRACVTGLAGYVRKNGFRSVLLGLSGGIDSALTATIAADAIGGRNVVGVSMPSRHSSEHSKDDAADLAERLGADYRVQPIAAMVDAFESQMDIEGVTAENLQARVRGVVLMAISNREGHLVIAPGNKSELATGYATIYDAGSIGGFAPLKDVDKSRVWALARWRNAHAAARGETPPIPESSITKPPSAELRPGQVDQDSLPPYDLLDEVLDAYVEHAEGRADLLARGYDEAVVDTVLSLVDRAEWKRRQYPLGPKVTALAFGRDRRLPVTSRWREDR
ncbi:NAD+ synthase [Cellulomonas sp. PhB143]|uniref:NAD+ synthase n=1 Tax=Cellulomonas sp. PhB143 TaxID=2485186 RepID=UPI000F4943C5|nr:NAD+ synthase [Cellulomonas sp. PhB143]ROS73055.1 NAD+ synthase (glutamine-hydrolysing) [Cellulomonas sp. PhB143]